MINEQTAASRPYSFRRMTSCNISLSSDKSATIRFSRLFSSSSWRSRFTSLGSKPPNFFFQLKYVAWLIPAFRQISATGVPSSPCFRTNAIWLSVNFYAFIENPLSSAMPQIAEFSNSNWAAFRGVGHNGRRRKLTMPELAVLALRQDAMNAKSRAFKT